MADVLEITDSTFESEVLKSQQPVLVDFWAPWCGPCRQIAPLIEELSRDNHGVVKVGKMNIDESPLTPQQFGINSIPTLMLFKDGDVVERFVGVQPKNRLQAAIDHHRSMA